MKTIITAIATFIFPVFLFADELKVDSCYTTIECKENIESIIETVDTTQNTIETAKTVVTVAHAKVKANTLMAKIHNNKKRMPLILTPETEKLWLAGNEIMGFTKPEIELKAVEF